MKTAKVLTALLLGTACSLGFSLTPTTTALSSSLNPSVYEQPVTFTAVVTPAPPDGETVTFLQGKTVLGTGTLSSGSTTFTISTLTTGGTDNIKAEYPGDASLASSTSNVVEQVVDPAATTTALVSSLNPSNGGQPVTFTATVTGQYGGTPTGKVTFYNGSAKLALVAMSGGVASYTTSTLPGGTNPITALYGGSNSFSASTSAVLNQTVNGGSGGPTTTTLTSSLNPSAYGQAVTFTAVVSPAPPNGETVEFIQGSATELGTGTLSGGTATFTISTLTTGGTDNVKAEYPGDSNFGSSTSNVVKQVVDKATTTTALTSSLNPSNGGQPVTFMATVTPQYTGTPTGKVQFYNGSAKLALVALSDGVASYTTSSLPSGTDSITGVYNGSNSFLTSTSAVLNQTVNGAGGGNCGTGAYIDSSMTWNGISRYYEVYLPAGLPANSPMVLMLHGTRTTPSTGSDPEPVISLNWGWPPVADQYCFLLVKPASTYDPTSHQWNWNAYCMDGTSLCDPYGSHGGAFAYAEGCGSTDGECPDDSGFLRALIGALVPQYNVNPNMVYVTGFSSGAEMTERVGVELSDIVAAIVPASGELYAAQGTVPPPLPLPPDAKAHISVQEWQGTEDDELPPCDYGTTLYSGVTFTLDTVDDTFNYWTGSQADAFTGQNAVFQTTATLCTPSESTSGVPNNANDAPIPPYPVIPKMPPTLSGNIAVSTVAPSGGWPSAPITAASEAGTTVTITSTLNPGVAGVAIITGMTPSGYNGTWVVTASTPTTFQYTNTASGLDAGTEFGTAAGGQNTEVQFIWEPGIAHSYQNQYDAARWYFFATHPKQ
jgi:predicted esterase